MYKNNKKYLLITVFLLIMIIGIGYATISSTLHINGFSQMKSSSFDVHFENITVTNGSVEIDTSRGDLNATIESTNRTRIDYAVTLEKPGDFYEFTVKVVNAGSIDAMIGLVTSKMNDEVINNETIPDYLEYSVTYDDDVEIEQNHLLKSLQYETFKVRVAYKSDINPDDLPTTLSSLNFNISFNYIQKGSGAVVRDVKQSPFTREISLASVQNANVQYDTSNVDKEKCVEYFDQYYDDDFDLDAYCSGETVTVTETIDYGNGTVVDEQISHNIYDDLSSAPPFVLNDLGDNGVIKSKYMKVSSYTIDKDKCLEVVDWFSDDDNELYCSGKETSYGYSIQKDIDDGYIDDLISDGIIKDVEYDELKPDIIITGYELDTPSDLVIPDTIDGGKVVGIADNAFDDKSISSLEIGSNVGFIGAKSFYSNNLTSVYIPDNVNSVGNRAFDDNDLNTVQLAKQNISLGNCAFGKKEEIEHNNISSGYKCYDSCETGTSNYDIGYKYYNGQYTYTYTWDCSGDICVDPPYGWSIQLTDKSSTAPVTSKICNLIDDKPILKATDMFNGSKASSIDLSSFDTSNVIDMSYMFKSMTEIVTLDLSSFDTSNVRNMREMFSGDSLLNRIFVSDKFVTDRVSQSNNIFSSCYNLVGGNGTDYKPWYDSALGMAVIDGANNDMGLFTEINDKDNVVLTYKCNPGYYLMANKLTCTICPAGSKCSGGTDSLYSIYQNYDQGIEDCESGKTSLEGSSSCTIIYGTAQAIINSCTDSCLTGTPNSDGLYKDANGDYRYAGSTPNNYAIFNDEIWRVVGVFSINGNQRIKLLKEDLLSGSDYWDMGSGSGLNQATNSWADSNLQNKLNNDTDGYLGTGYKNASLSQSSQEFIDTVDWNVSPVWNYNYTSQSYSDERAGNVVNQKVGLIYPSDFGYASNNCRNDVKRLSEYNNNLCKGSNWMTNNISSNWYTISPYQYSDGTCVNCGDCKDCANFITSSGSVEFNHVSNSWFIRPTVYLKPNVIVFGKGKNTDGERFTFSLE